MIYSKNNIIVPLRKARTNGYAILNPLSGSFDLMNETEYQLVESFQANGLIDQTKRDFYEYLLERGYLFKDKETETNKIQEEFVKFQMEIENSQTQLLLIPSYGCNLACAYCYEHGMTGKSQLITKETVDAFFNYIRGNFGDRKLPPFVTLFGGEPLMGALGHREMVRYIIENCNRDGYELAVVTNGYELASYMDILAQAKVKEIQVTLDGIMEIHDKRRGTAGGGGSFERIVAGIEAAVKNGFPINLRTVVDLENLNCLVNLAEFLDSKGWLDLGPERFKTQIGRNYELFDCYAKPEHLMTQVQLWSEFVNLSYTYPILKKFHRPDFKGIRHLVDTGSLYLASFDTCPAAKTEWVFDLYGDIYGCTASCGRLELKLGSYYPEVSLDRERIAVWQNRNVLTIPECRDCGYNIICGGGCGVVASHKSGAILSPDCRSIQEIIDLGINYYSDAIEKMATPGPVFTSGCLVCGADLEYKPQAISTTCAFCNRTYETLTACKNGHYVCDECHRRDILEVVAQICLQTELTDPVALAWQIFDLPGLNMHGPEYHSIVPAIIVSVYGNTIKDTGKKEINLRMALERGKTVKGGFCGTHGACGAAIGIGVAYSIIHQVNPLSTGTRGEANRLTAKALLAMSDYGGPRCCKRETITTLEVARELIPGLSQTSSYVCRQFKDNKDCLKRKCPYFPKADARAMTEVSRKIDD